MEASNIAVHHEDQYILLETSEVKERAENIPEEELEKYLEAIPQFSKQKSIIFTDLDQNNSMKDDYIFIRDSLKNLENEAHGMQSIIEEMSIKQKSDKSVSHFIQDLKDFSKLLTQGITERIYRLKDPGSHFKTMNLSHLDLEGFSSSVKDTVQDSENHVSASVLNSDVVEIISKKVLDDQILRLDAILHGLHSLRNVEKEEYWKVNYLIIKVQRNIFQTVVYMYKQEIISAKALKAFFQMKKTFQLATWNMYLAPRMDEINDSENTYYAYENSISTLRKWYSAHFRTLNEVIHQYSQIRNKVQDLIEMFQNSKSSKDTLAAFFVLDFIQNNYGLEILDVQKGELFQEKMNSISSRLQLLSELENVMQYIGKKTSLDTQIDYTGSMGEEAVWLYKYYHLLISKIQPILTPMQSEDHFLNQKLHETQMYISGTLERIILSNQYYSLK
ncbi:hypothetical protein VP01_3578g2 [Puccinia sorghi]|uniref:Uncharacterized protein n=1 Tax=Puccinia sorghi TaxID=27349 RepID=A0A0L6UW33_9BASI|nr:hypothetical protein VP01_3578g2 [Puccinia sorghi]